MLALNYHRIRTALRVLCLLALLALAPAAWTHAAQSPIDPKSLLPDPLREKGFAPQQMQLQTLQLNDAVQHVNLTPWAQMWVDDSKDTTVSQLLARATSGAEMFKPSREHDVLRIHGKVLWLRFAAQTTTSNARWLLEVGNPLADDVQLYWKDTQGVWQVQKAGDAVPRVQWPIQARMPSFTLDLTAGEPVEYMLRMKHQRAPVSLQLNLYQDRAYIAQQHSQTLLLGLFFGLLLLVFVGSLTLAAIMRDIAFLAYSGYIAVLGGFMFTNVGLSALYIWPDSPVVADRMVFVLASLSAAVAPVLVRLILEPVMAKRKIDAALRVMILVMLSLGALEAVAPSMLSYGLINGGTALSLVLVYVVVYAAWQRGNASARWVAIGFLPVVLGVIPILARNLGLIGSGFFTQYGMLVGIAFEVPILLYALTSRSTRRRDVLMRSAGLPMEDALTRLPNLRAFITHLHGVITRATRYRQNYGLMIIELANEAWFAKEHTREVADQALILLASRLQRISRDIDVVSRIGATQFALAIEGPCDARKMANWVTRIAAYGQKPNEVLPVGASLKLKITCAIMPKAAEGSLADEANEHLAWVIAQADAQEPGSRNSVVTLGF